MKDKRVARTVLLLAFGLVGSAASADCRLLSVADVERVLGPGVNDLSGDDAESQCYFLVGSSQATFIVQIGSRDYYDDVSILKPHTPVDVGERGRSNVDTNGVAAVQFVQGDKSVTLSLRSTRKDGRDNLDALITLAKAAAARLK